MRLEPDYEELLRSFNKHKVKFCIVGAYALAFHAQPRYTKDMDILIEASTKNGAKIIKALKDFGFGTLKLSANDFTKEKQVVQLGYDPVRIDLLTSVEGCTFKEVWQHKKAGEYGEIKVYFIGRNELIKNKKALSRPQDKVDLELLRKKK
ncbi:MAG: hypothetical protein KJ732_06330 [Candidatus Margulisbacteria bacterium]|nr:hypothetical protein [Candidatus Margulisiibacteriota bacterium]